jgi:hypothetical protein
VSVFLMPVALFLLGFIPVVCVLLVNAVVLLVRHW